MSVSTARRVLLYTKQLHDLYQEGPNNHDSAKKAEIKSQ